MLLVLWDIDGTLVDTAGYGRDAFADAFRALFGRAPAGNVPMPGRTDHEIALAILEESGVHAAESHLPRMWEELANALAAKKADIRVRGQVKPGAREALAAIERREGVVQSLLTGNIEPNAAVKLGAFGLDRHLDLEVGGYGSHPGVRAELVEIARSRAARKYRSPVHRGDVVVIGDTPRDVAAAREAGVRAVGVASGPYGEDALAESSPDVVLPDLTDTAAVLRAVGV